MLAMVARIGVWLLAGCCFLSTWRRVSIWYLVERLELSSCWIVPWCELWLHSYVHWSVVLKMFSRRRSWSSRFPFTMFLMKFPTTLNSVSIHIVVSVEELSSLIAKRRPSGHQSSCFKSFFPASNVEVSVERLVAIIIFFLPFACFVQQRQPWD